MMENLEKIHKIDNSAEVLQFDCQQAFENLNNSEQNYVHALCQASWAGGLINLIQCSAESAGIFLLAQRLFRSQKHSDVEKLMVDELGFSANDVRAFFIYFCAIYGNLGNYKSFGDTKIIPNMDKDKFSSVIAKSIAYAKDPKFVELWNLVKDKIFSLEPNERKLNFSPQGVTTYFSANCTSEDGDIAQAFLDSKNISAYNTRLCKHLPSEVRNSDGDSSGIKAYYKVWQASALPKTESNWETFESKGERYKFSIKQGDYQELMSTMVDGLKQLLDNDQIKLNSLEREMFTDYIRSFESGSIDDHKAGSRAWVKNKGPIVENYIGFIESYRDPQGTRGEFESFIAVVNKVQSQVYGELVAAGQGLVEKLPWPADFEKNTFLSPDFTSLDIINFANSGIPIGINIPNYDDIRQDFGFKNVSLGNIMACRSVGSKVTFVPDDQQQLFKDTLKQSREINVALHELIGHGTGKLLQEEANGSLNFNKEAVIDPTTEKPVSMWYKHGQSYYSVFGTIGSAYEECRAEAVAMYLAAEPKVNEIFKTGDEKKRADCAFVTWLAMMRGGLSGLTFYSPDGERWGQAHCQARYVLLQVILEAGCLKLDQVMNENDGEPDLVLRLDRDKIQSVGMPALGKFMRNMQVFKSTGDFERGKEMFNRYSAVNEHWIKVRDIVVSRAKARDIIIQPVTELVKQGNDSAIVLHNFPNTTAGMIDSFQKRFSGSYGEKLEAALESVWRRDFGFFGWEK